jgi:hypothetical protein
MTAPLDVNAVVDAAQRLPAAPDAHIDSDFQHVADVWNAGEIIVVPAEGVRWSIAETLAGDVKEQFTLCKSGPRQGCPGFQFDTLKLDHAGSPIAFRPYVIAKRQDGLYARYGHEAMYRHLGTLDRSLDPLVQELIVIGISGDFAISDRGTLKISSAAREIGARLNVQGGMWTMRAAHTAVSNHLGRIAAKNLEIAWDGIGEWMS